MDARLIILAVASTFLIVAVLYFVVSLTGAKRGRHYDEAESVMPTQLDRAVRESLNTPLDVGTWAPAASVPRAEPADASVATPSVAAVRLPDVPQAAPVVDTPVAAVVAPEPEPLVVPDYTMVAPVELSFSDGAQRVGIRPGTATFLKYQRLAAVLLSDLKRAQQH
jgi:hypothetical protein